MYEKYWQDRIEWCEDYEEYQETVPYDRCQLTMEVFHDESD